ncbi:huntingtin [Orussus abietinus]|uniref:huntingtin n=1 Tax=Orussus abietinus TaxID=222816 RepID=UPI000C716016|nr:huntingtin [Orussus abietinus]
MKLRLTQVRCRRLSKVSKRVTRFSRRQRTCHLSREEVCEIFQRDQQKIIAKMAGLNNVIKAMEFLKGLQDENITSQDSAMRKKEVMVSCVAIADGICSPNIKTASRFSHILGVSIQTLLALCDDPESDVRMVADECLNRIIRAMTNGNILKVQVELYNEIKRNGPARSLRAALWRFAILSHAIRPMKGKTYVSNLIPCIVIIAERTEESVINTLSTSLPMILKTLGPFMTDNDVKVLLKVFFQNIPSSQAVFRRAAANMILTTCLNCSKPQVFLHYVLEYLIDTVVPVSKEEDHLPTVTGVLGCLRVILPRIVEPTEPGSGPVYSVDRLLQIYELCLYFAKWHSDHNVVNAALETLAQLLQSSQRSLISCLLSETGITQSRITSNENVSRLPLSRMSVATVTSGPNSSSTLNLFEPDMSEIAPKVERWIADSENALSVIHRPPRQENFPSESVETAGKPMENYSNLTIGPVESECAEEGSDVGSDVERLEKMSNPSTLSHLSKDEEYSDDAVLSITSPHRTAFSSPFPEVDVGSITDMDVPLKYCCRYLASSFLLTGSAGQCIPDKMFRVSVKSLALTCIGHALRLCPTLLSISVAKNPSENPQLMSDILLFADHPDPQIRGNISIIIGSYLSAVFTQYGGVYRGKDSEEEREPVPLEKLIDLLLKGLQDESSGTCRQTLIALSTCLVNLLESVDNKCGIPLLTALPQLVKNPYFLVKIKLVEVLSELPYTTIEYITGGTEFQENAIAVMVKLLGDQDQRVRQTASTSIVKIIPVLYYRHPDEDSVTRKAFLYTEQYLSAVIREPLETSFGCRGEQKLFINSLVRPFKLLCVQSGCDNGNDDVNERIEDTLSRMVNVLAEQLAVVSSKHLIYGCCEALSRLSEAYPTTMYPKAWDCYLPKAPVKKMYKRSNSRIEVNEAGLANEVPTTVGNGLLSLTISLLSSSPISLDLSTHRHLILLSGNLASGMALCNLKLSDPTTKNDLCFTKFWTYFKDKQTSQHLELLLVHVVRLLNIFVHVINEIPLVQSSMKSALPSLTATQSLSPKKKLLPEHKSKEKEERASHSFFGKEHMGSFSSVPHYVKLFDILKSADSNYKVTLDSEASEMYLSLLNASLEVLCQILEVAALNEAGPIAEEILHYLQTTVVLSPTYTVQGVQQLLKCLSGTNLSARWYENELHKSIDGKNGLRDDVKGFYDGCFQRPARRMAEIIRIMGNNCRDGSESDTRWFGLLHRRGERKLSAFKGLTRSTAQKASIASFIRLFEPMVIKSLKQYTITSCIELQSQVLMLLSQLVQLHINYCLLDSDQIFIEFVIKQFEFIEKGQIQRAEEVLPKIFNFLVHLSYEKYHSKVIIGVPKIINLCDGLMASGQLPLTHCIPALTPVVEDIFLARGTSTNISEQKELDTTREVLMAMLLKLAEYHQVIELLALCLTEFRYSGDGNGEEKWRRWSRSTTDVVLPMLANGEARIESREAHVAFVKLFAALSQTVFKPVDPLLRVLFVVPPTLYEPTLKMERWMGMVNVMLLSLISYAKEEAMLARLSDLTMHIPGLIHMLLNAPGATSSLHLATDPLNVQRTRDFEVTPEKIIAQFIFRTAALVGRKIYNLLGLREDERFSSNTALCTDSNDYLIHQFAFFLQLCIHMFESGSHCKVANATMQMIQGCNTPDERKLPMANLNALMLSVSSTCPLITCQWTYLMTLLSYNEMSFWSKVLGVRSPMHAVHAGAAVDKVCPKNKRPGIGSSVNIDIVRRGSTILFCDYVCENLGDAEPLTWLLVNHIEETINLATESPVRELVAAAVHRNPAASGLLVQAIAARCLHLSRPSFVKRLLQCMEGAHHSQSGALILALVPRMLASKHMALSRMVAKIASRRVEILLTLKTEDAKEQLSKEDLIKTMEALQTTKLARKHGGLVSLLNKLGSQHYDLSPLDLEHCRPFNPSTIKNIQLDRKWFLAQVKLRCCHPSASYGSLESAQLLNNLDAEACSDILSSKEFNIRILKECIRLSVRTTVETCQNVEINVTAEEGVGFRESPLYTASKQCLLQHVQNINELVPKPHYIFSPTHRANGKDVKYTTRFSELMQDTLYRETLFMVIPAVVVYLQNLKKLSNYDLSEIDEMYEEDLAKLAMLCLESAHWMVHCQEVKTRMYKPSELQLSLDCAEEILKHPRLSKIFGNAVHHSWVCSSAATLTRIASHFLMAINPLPIVDGHGLEPALSSEETKTYANACLQMGALVAWLEKCQVEGTPKNVPFFVFRSLKSLVVSIGRMPLVNSFVLTPPQVWKHGWRVVGSGPTKCSFPLLSSESNFLQEIEILEQFVYRVTLLGWTSRLQFEEIWMALLGVLNVSPNDNMLVEELAVLNHVTGLAVQAITALLTQTLLLPNPGNPGNSCPMFHSRDPQLSLNKVSSKKLFSVQDTLTWKFECVSEPRDQARPRLYHIFDRGNIERVANFNRISYGQLSVPYLWASCSLHEDKLSSGVISLRDKRNHALLTSSLDLESCLRFLLDLFTSWTLPQANTHLRLLNEVVKSILCISELFDERGQFQWMLDTCLEISRLHSTDNVILHQYLVIAVCKAAAVLTPLDVETLEKVKRLVDNSLKSGFLPARVSALHGFLYLLQSAVLADCEETMNIVHPLAIEYIQKHIDSQDSNGVLSQSEEHQGIMWALVFFLLEHAEDAPPDSEAPAVLELVLSLVSSSGISTALHQTLLQGLERLVATRSVVGKVAEQIAKVAIDRLKHVSPVLALPALQLLLTCMYTEAADRLNRPDVEEPLPDVEPEALVRSIERTSAIFDRIKKGYPMEVEILCTVLSEVLADFFPPSEILTKVIGEFLSPQQPHPRLLSAVVFKVFERACKGTQLSLLQDWVVFSLPNFIQSLPVAMFTWCLTCFFISASANQWLRALFPHVQSRIGKYEYEDKKILCIAASNFYRQLSSESQKVAFRETFQSAAKEPGTPFGDILASF